MLIVLAVDGYATLLERVIGNKIGGISVKRLTSKRSWEEAKSDLKHEMGYSHIWKRLAEIENILGDDGDDYDLDRLKELVQADREGRYVVLPCKIGSKLYRTSMRKMQVYEVSVGREYFHNSKNNATLFAVQIFENGKKSTSYECFKEKDIGKTVFLTPEEAEAALEKMKEDK